MKTKTKKQIKYIDFCSGIGGGKIACDNARMISLGFSEIDKDAIKTYNLFFGEEKNYGDLMKIKKNNIPNFDFMIAGFPCQTFSIVGKREGLKDNRGQIIFGLTKLMREKNVKYFILENVKGLVSHDRGNSLKVILDELDRSGFYVFYSVLNSINYGVPQMRERIYFVGIKKTLLPKDTVFRFPKSTKTPNISKFLIDDDIEQIFDEKSSGYKTLIKYLNNKYNKGKHNLEDILKNDYTVLDARQSDLRIYKDRVPTLRTGRHGIYYVKNKKLRKLSGYESLLLQGFPKRISQKAKGKIKDSVLLRQSGNAMTVTTVNALIKSLLKLNK